MALAASIALAEEDMEVDFSAYSTSSPVEVHHREGRLRAEWPMESGERGGITLDLRPGRPLIESFRIKAAGKSEWEPLLEGVEPVIFVTLGTRTAPPGRPPGMSPWNVFFDKPASRPHQTFLSRLEIKRARVHALGGRAVIALSGLKVGSFEGEILFTFYTKSRLVHMEAVVATREESRAMIYDMGLASGTPTWRGLAWMDTAGNIQRLPVDRRAEDQPLAVRHRAIVAESEPGSVACFPPPHQYQFPRDLTDNFKFIWTGRGHGGLTSAFGFGVRQDPEGGGAFVPWFNAPPNTQQRLGVFYLLSRGRAETALEQVLRYTHGDHFPAIPGRLTFTSHWHMAVAVAAMARREEGAGPAVPDFVRMFKDMGVNMVHLAEFHGDGHPSDPGPLRLPEQEAMFQECRRLSGGELLLMPGEEINTFLGIGGPGRHPGHWMSFFPKPVYWVMRREKETPFTEEHPKYGTVYRVGDRKDMVELLQREDGLAWTSHPRIKASSWTPDIFRHEDFYLAGFWLGAAWKAMPADLSSPRLGERALDLLNDMANWGQKKYLPGEVDVFKINSTHELYAHMNMNYLKLARLPRFEEGWKPVLDALRAGQFFVTTGEVLLHDFTVGGKESGETLKLPRDGLVEVKAALEWTFPLQFAEVISGDGDRVYREQVALSDTGPFDQGSFYWKLDLRGRRWVRFEAWDVAVNGAFTQPVWLD
jgi:hypothetical protein